MGICCFSSIEDNILLWSHYANYHKGVCFKFDIKEDTEFFVTPVTVNYRQMIPHYNVSLREDTIEYLIRPKYAEWSYESEVRVVKAVQNIRKNGGKRVFKYKDPALKEIIFGMKTSLKDIDEYKKLCHENRKTSVLFSQMKLDAESPHYRLKKESI